MLAVPEGDTEVSPLPWAAQGLCGAGGPAELTQPRGCCWGQDVDVGALSHTVTGLKKFTEYSFRVVAYNKHGPGVSTHDVVVRTLSDGKAAPLPCVWGVDPVVSNQ